MSKLLPLLIHIAPKGAPPFCHLLLSIYLSLSLSLPLAPSPTLFLPSPFLFSFRPSLSLVPFFPFSSLLSFSSPMSLSSTCPPSPTQLALPVWARPPCSSPQEDVTESQLSLIFSIPSSRRNYDLFSFPIRSRPCLNCCPPPPPLLLSFPLSLSLSLSKMFSFAQI